MVRFARADGSKGSNKRTLEEATPWSEMVSQMNTKETGTEEIKGIDLKGINNKPTNEEGIDLKKKKKKRTDKEGIYLKRKKKKHTDEGGIDLKRKENKPIDDTADKVEYEPQEVKDPEGNESNEESAQKPFIKKKTARVVPVVDESKFVFENGQKFQLLDNGKKRPWFELPYEESDRMTRFEGFWMRPDMVKKMKDLKQTLNETMDAELARKKMMKAKRKAHKDLTRELIYEQKNEFMEKGGKDDKTVVKQKEEEDINAVNDEERLDEVLFEGYWVTKEGAARLKKLKADLMRKGVSKEQTRYTMKGERRKEEKALKREKKRVCLRCRKRGHMVNQCPEDIGGYGAEQNCICYACGSTEHKVNDCPQAGDQAAFPHATCFVCRRVGHISRQCPDNPRGLYPNGGSCRGCGSVEHLAASCYVIQSQQEKNTIKVGRINRDAVESLDLSEVDFSERPEPTKASFRKPNVKTVSF